MTNKNMTEYDVQEAIKYALEDYTKTILDIFGYEQYTIAVKGESVKSYGEIIDFIENNIFQNHIILYLVSKHTPFHNDTHSKYMKVYKYDHKWYIIGDKTQYSSFKNLVNTYSYNYDYIRVYLSEQDTIK